MPRCQRTGFRRSAQRRRRSTVYGEPSPPAPSVLYRSRKPHYRCSLVLSSTRHAVNLRRALGGALAVLASAFAFGFLIAPAARATPLPPSLSPLPGSSFQGADGNQDDALPAIDWQAMQAAERVHHSPDPNAQDTAFTGGTEEDKPGLWDLTTEAGRRQPGQGQHPRCVVVVRSTGRQRVPLPGVRAGGRLIAHRTYPASRRDDVHHVRAQPRPATMGQRTGHDSMPDHGRRARLVRGAGQRCQRRDPTLGHDADRCGERVCHYGTTRQLHGLHAECRRSGRGQRDGDSYVPAGRVRRHDPRPSASARRR